MPVPAPPLVSVVIPVMNGGDWLAEAIDSALAQTWLNLEVIVVDDGSTDGGHTRAVAESYGDQITYIHQENRGVAGALNTGIRAMRGEFFSWLSHDDRYLPEKVETQLRALLAAGGTAIAFGDSLLIDDDDEAIGEANWTQMAQPDDHPLWLVLDGVLSGCALLVPRACFEECDLFDEGLPTTQDYELWFRMAQRFPFVPVPGRLVETRVHAQQGSRVRRHLDEAGLLWTHMLESIPPGLRARMAPSEAALLARMARSRLLDVYPAAAAAVERLRAHERARHRLSVVVEAGDPEMGQGIRGALLAAGFADPELVFVAPAATADAARLGVLYLRLRRLGRLLTGDPDDGAPDLLAWALAEAAEPLVLIHDHRDPAGRDLLRRRVDVLLEEAACAIVPSRSGRPGSAETPFGPLAGAVVRRDRLLAALQATQGGGLAEVVEALAAAARVWSGAPGETAPGPDGGQPATEPPTAGPAPDGAASPAPTEAPRLDAALWARLHRAFAFRLPPDAPLPEPSPTPP